MGIADDFLKGCPSCGYLSDVEAEKAALKLKTGRKKEAKDLPVWFYLLSLGFLLVSVAVLAAVLFNMQ